MAKIVALIAAVFILSSCAGTPESREGLDPERKIQTYKVSYEEVPSYLEATGSIQPDIEGSSKIISPLAGTIENIFVRVGDRVKKGDVLAVIRSTEVSDAYSNYLSNLAQLKQAERLYNLNMQLYEVGAITQNDLLNSEANYERTKALSGALRRKLEIYGVTSDQEFSDNLMIPSPMDGAVVEIPGHIGDRIDTANPIMKVADSRKVMVVASIYDTKIARVHKGKEVIFYTDTFSDTPFRGVVTYISDTSDVDTKTIKTYIRILNDQNLLKENMFLKLKIMNGSKKLPVVPKTALLYKDGRFKVYLKEGKEFGLKEVKPVFEGSAKLIAVEGLKEGDEIILSAIEEEKT